MRTVAAKGGDFNGLRFTSPLRPERYWEVKESRRGWRFGTISMLSIGQPLVQV